MRWLRVLLPSSPVCGRCEGLREPREGDMPRPEVGLPEQKVLVRPLPSPSRLGEAYRKELAIGTGCCSPLFNEDRKNIPPPQTSQLDEMTYTIPKEAQILITAFAQEWISSDTIWLALRRAEQMLGDERFFKACMHLAMQQRASHIENFMG